VLYIVASRLQSIYFYGSRARPIKERLTAQYGSIGKLWTGTINLAEVRSFLAFTARINDIVCRCLSWWFSRSCDEENLNKCWPFKAIRDRVACRFSSRASRIVNDINVGCKRVVIFSRITKFINSSNCCRCRANKLKSRNTEEHKFLSVHLALDTFSCLLYHISIVSIY